MTHPPDPNSPKRRRMASARRTRWSRTIGLALGFLMIGSVLFELSAPAAHWVIAFVVCAGWPQLAYLHALRAPDARIAERRNLLLDQFIGGAATPVMGFNLLPSVLALSLPSMNTIAGGGPRLLLVGLAAHAAGLGVGVLFLAAPWSLPSTTFIVLACMPVMLAQPVAVSLTARFAIAKLQVKRRELERRGQHDGLSGLFNRAHWESLVQAEFERCRNRSQPATLVMADLDHFKRINDLLGHAAGDEAIRRFADTLRRGLRPTDAAGRYGGEEFGLLLPGTTAAAARDVVERLRRQLHECPLLGRDVVTASFGAVELSSDMESHDVWLRLADQMLYRAKHLGRDRVSVLGDTETAAGRARPVYADCLAALEDRAVLLHLLGGLDRSAAAFALFDPTDHLVLANPAFRTLYNVQPQARTFADVFRHCYEHVVGPVINSDDIEGWLRMAGEKRRSKPHRSFTVDMLDGVLFRADETSFSDGWVLLALQSIPRPEQPRPSRPARLEEIAQ